MRKQTVKALMVEDLQMAQRVAQVLFTKMNCLLDIVPLASKGLEKTLLSNYDILFIDIQLPDINGLDFIQTIRDTEIEETRIPIVVITSTPTKELQIKAEVMGCDDFIKKPLTLACLREILLKHLDQKKVDLLNLNAV